MSEFPAKIAQFIDQQIESLAQLEALLLLRTRPDHIWVVDEIAKSLYITPEMTDLLLTDLIRRGWADPRSTRCWSPRSSRIRCSTERSSGSTGRCECRHVDHGPELVEGGVFFFLLLGLGAQGGNTRYAAVGCSSSLLDADASSSQGS